MMRASSMDPPPSLCLCLSLMLSPSSAPLVAARYTVAGAAARAIEKTSSLGRAAIAVCHRRPAGEKTRESRKCV